MPKLKELAAKHADQGLVLIGVHSARGGERMAAYVEETGIQYPVAIDTGSTVESYFVDGYPDYHIIDRAGNLRVADLSNGDVERVVGLLLAEPAPSTIHPALVDASAAAKKKDKRMLVHWGTVEEHAEVSKLLKADRELSTLMRNEFELVRIVRGQHHDLIESLAVERDTQFLAALLPDGTFKGSMTSSRIDAESLRGFLEQQRVPIKDAEALWADALAQAEREKKRVLVHLGAPW